MYEVRTNVSRLSKPGESVEYTCTCSLTLSTCHNQPNVHCCPVMATGETTGTRREGTFDSGAEEGGVKGREDIEHADQ